MDIIQIPTHLIDEDKEQPRYQFDEEALQELMSSIEELGLLSPIKVRTASDGRYKIIYGNRRYKACTALNLPTIPCIVSNVTDEMEIYLEQIAENLTRQGFSPIEEAEAFNKLLTDPKFSSSVKYLSSKLGKPENYIKNKLELLKFSSAVRSLIVYGTEIRKDKLTEDQLMPLKDLSMEYRDSLALIMAQDEMPVPDVKRIARLFKDKEISDSTKGKLLFKTGPQLLETWSSFEQTKKERAKSAEPKEETVTDKAPSPSPASAVRGNGEPTEPGTAARAEKPISPLSAITSVLDYGSNEETELAEDREQPSESFIEGMLNLLLATLPAPSNLSPKDLPDLEGVERAQFVQDVDTLINDLEKHLAEWRSVKDMMLVKP
ncbi:ParB/RepB/Spo0J family partition protein [Cohnella cholangitidis]|uniref:ParB/RepB/Spo0J family partition protein n=1 Tax=Cohnella cholangitidis TaxID=2598458 RepID=A0A7G5C0M9_9BACL|nr:ParB/RepB/Spo0J family partition protein [Cohnella cholangitidis]QMV42763.1 ParB/RepB/Spo0J family partition protein [Cohnella cholangitidis]